MSTSRPFAYNPSPNPTISGTTQVGSLAVGIPTSGFTSNPQFWNGPDEELGYVIAYPVSGNTHPTPLFSGAPSGQLTLSSTYRGSDINLSNGNQTAYQQFGYQQSVLGQTFLENNDKVMYSVVCSLITPLTLPNSHYVGFGTTSMNYQGNPYGGFPGNDNQSIGFSSGGEYWYNGAVQASGLPTWTSGDTIDVAVDLTNNKVWVRVNGGNWNNNSGENPATGTGSLGISGLTSFYPALCPGYEGTMIIQNTATYGTPSSYTLLGTNITASVGFLGTKNMSNPLSEATFVDLTNSSFNQNFTNGNDASTWLTSNGYWNNWVFITPTPTPTITQTPTTSATPGSSPTPTATNTQTPTGTPAPTPVPQYYYMSPNSWAPPTISQGPGDNFLITDQTVQSSIGYDGYYSDDSWSFSFWAYPQFEYTSLPSGIQISKFASIAIPLGTNPPYPDNAASNLTIGSEYTSGGTLVNDLVVWMTEETLSAGTFYVKWTWEINQNTNATITGIDSTKMWDINNYGSTSQPQRFTNLTFSFDSTLRISSPSTSVKAYWNGIPLTLKSYTTNIPGSFIHLGLEYDNMKIYLADGGNMGNPSNLVALSTSLDAVSYYPLTVLTQSNAASIYNGGTMSPYALNVGIGTYTWNFDSVSFNHLQCLDNANSNYPDFELVAYNPNSPNIITYPLL